MYTIVTHNGSFDPDDVLAAATIELYLGKDNTQIVRSREQEVIDKADWVIDVGGKYDAANKRFDHHQNGVPHRDNQVPYSSFGLVWREIGAEVSGSQEVADMIEEKLVQPVDSADNQVKVCEPNELGVVAFEFFDVIDAFKPVWGSEEDFDTGFVRATSFARKLLRRMILRAQGELAMKALVAEVYQNADDKSILVFDKSIAKEALVDYEEVKAFVSPVLASESTNWMAVAVPKDTTSFVTRVKVPEAWAGLNGDNLAEVSGIKDAVFCHKSRNLFVAESKESAMEAAKQFS